MVSLILVAHAPLASAMCAVAAHTFPHCGTQLTGLDVPPEWDLARTESEIRQLLPHNGPVLILTDVQGATPANAAAAALVGRAESALAFGVNVPMVWRSLCYGCEDLAALTQRALDGAVRGVGQA